MVFFVSSVFSLLPLFPYPIVAFHATRVRALGTCFFVTVSAFLFSPIQFGFLAVTHQKSTGQLPS